VGHLPEVEGRGTIAALMSSDLLFEIGVEELPAGFVTQAIAALRQIVGQSLTELRLEHGSIWVSGTPRRLSVFVEALADAQPDLDEQVVGPPARVAFDAEGRPTKAAESFATKLGIPLDQLGTTETEKGAYLCGRRCEKGQRALTLLPAALADWCQKIPFRKSMRWGSGEVAFGRPIRWLLGLLGTELLPFAYAGLSSARTTEGHRFLAKGPFVLERAADYRELLRGSHVVVDLDERKATMVERLHQAAASLGGKLVEDEFLVDENSCLVEDPRVVIGQFDPAFLALPEQVILNVARGHQRYFGVRDASGRLLPRYLSVVGTAESPENVQRGGDRVMRARLSDARFFFDTDLERPLEDRQDKLEQVVFHKRLGSVGDKVRRIVKLVDLLGKELALPEDVVATARAGALLAKCDLVTLMVGEFPELQGEMGRAYALRQGRDPKVAAVIEEHYQPRGAEDPTAASDAGALVAIADRIDTLVGCFAVGQVPTGASDPLALRRATIGLIRTLLDRGWEVSIDGVARHAYVGYQGVALDQSADETVARLAAFFKDRLRGLLTFPGDVVEAVLGTAADSPVDARARATALANLEPELRASVGEVFKRAANIAKEAPDAAEPVAPTEVTSEPHPSEVALFTALTHLKQSLMGAERERRYEGALQAIAAFAPVLARFFVDVFVMADDPRLRHNRLRLMADIQRTCSKIANFDLLANRKGV